MINALTSIATRYCVPRMAVGGGGWGDEDKKPCQCQDKCLVGNTHKNYEADQRKHREIRELLTTCEAAQGKKWEWKYCRFREMAEYVDQMNHHQLRLNESNRSNVTTSHGIFWLGIQVSAYINESILFIIQLLYAITAAAASSRSPPTPADWSLLRTAERTLLGTGHLTYTALW
jgi:hypothetical protein